MTTGPYLKTIDLEPYWMLSGPSFYHMKLVNFDIFFSGLLRVCQKYSSSKHWKQNNLPRFV